MKVGRIVFGRRTRDVLPHEGSQIQMPDVKQTQGPRPKASRKYSLDEIDAMRRALDDIVRLEYRWDSFTGVTAKREIVELRLRTYMANGTAPEELIERGEKASAEW